MSKEQRLLDAQYCVEQLRKNLASAGILEYSEAYLDGIMLALRGVTNE